MSQPSPSGRPPNARVSVARNPKARHDFHVLDTYEAGVMLRGTEVKALRAGKASIKEAWAVVRGGEVWLEGMHITPYEQGNRWNHEPVRSRKLLLHRKEIDRLRGGVEQGGLTIVPLELYFSKGKAKVEIALARGKKTHDRRQDLKQRQHDREMARALSQRSR